MPIGIPDKQTGNILVEQNWWLFFYNLSQNVLGVGAGGVGGSTGLPATALIEMASLDADADDADAVVLRAQIDRINALTALVVETETDAFALRAPIANLNSATGVMTETETDAFALRQPVSAALLLAQDGLAQIPAPAAQPVVAITPGASPFTYTAPFSGQVAVTGGTVSVISLIRQGTTVATGLTVGLFPVSRLDQVQITYAVAPTMTLLPS